MKLGQGFIAIFTGFGKLNRRWVFCILCIYIDSVFGYNWGMNGERIALLTDTASSLTLSEADKLGISLIPFHITFPDGKQVTDHDLDQGELYEMIRKYGIPITSGPNPDDFFNYYGKLCEQGFRRILSIHLGVTSMTIDSAFNAVEKVKEKYPDTEICIYNSRALTLAQLFQVSLAKELIDQGENIDVIIQKLEKTRDGIALFGSTGKNSMEFLKRSRRLNGLESLIGRGLNLIPIVSLNEDGNIKKNSVTVGEKKARIKVVELLRREIDRRGNLPQEIGIAYTKDPDVGEDLRYRMRDLLSSPNVYSGSSLEAGSVLAVHVGERVVVAVPRWNLI